MKNKIIDLSQTVYELCSVDPQVTIILARLGFRDITKPGMLGTAGRLMTIPKGAKLKGMELKVIKVAFLEYGYQVKEDFS